MKRCKTKNCLDEKILNRAVTTLSSGGIVAFPTETYYGLAVDYSNENALEKLFKIKGRPTDKPILVLIRCADQLKNLTDSIPDLYHPLIRQYWPGPLTLIFKATKEVNSILTGGSGTLGIRISSHRIARILCDAWKSPITATSANISGMPPAVTAREVFDYFGNGVDFIIDGGSTPAGLCSTIVSHEKNQLKLVRKGQIHFDEL